MKKTESIQWPTQEGHWFKESGSNVSLRVKGFMMPENPVTYKSLESLSNACKGNIGALVLSTNGSKHPLESCKRIKAETGF